MQRVASCVTPLGCLATRRAKEPGVGRSKRERVHISSNISQHPPTFINPACINHGCDPRGGSSIKIQKWSRPHSNVNLKSTIFLSAQNAHWVIRDNAVCLLPIKCVCLISMRDTNASTHPLSVERVLFLPARLSLPAHCRDNKNRFHGVICILAAVL